MIKIGKNFEMSVITCLAFSNLIFKKVSNMINGIRKRKFIPSMRQ